MQKEIDNLDFVQAVSIEYIDGLKDKRLKYLLIFDESFKENWNSKACVDIVTAGRHRGLSTINLYIYIRHDLFGQSKPRRDVEF